MNQVAAPRTLSFVNRPDDRYYTSARLRLHYVVWGDEKKPPLLLIHGGRDHARSWDFVARRLIDRFAVYAPDLRGHGDSDWANTGSYPIVDHVADIAKLVEVIDRGPVSIIGHSRGGGITLDYAGGFPDMVTRLVSIEGYGWRAGDKRPAVQRLRGFVDNVRAVETGRPRVYATLEDAQARMQEANRRLSPEMVRHLTEHAVRRVEGGYVWKFDRNVQVHTASDWTEAETKSIWSNIRCPMLLIGGSESGHQRPELQGIGDSLVGERIVIQDAAHWVHHDQFERFVQAVRRFLLA